MSILGILIAIVEWFNLSTYIYYANIMSKTILPLNINDDVRLSLFQFLLVLINIGKPIGSYLFGKYSDKFSRIKTILLSFFLMFIVTIFTSILPSYEKIGIFSCILFGILNFIKGLAAGGNYSATVYSIEKAKYKYFVSSLITCGIFIGMLLSQLSLDYLSWRNSLQLAAFLSVPILALIIKANITQSEEKIVKKEEMPIQTASKKEFLGACCLVLLDIITYYFIFSFIPNYKIVVLKDNPINVENKRKITTAIVIFLTPIMGYLADKFGPKNFLKTSAVMLFCSSFFYFFGNFFSQYQLIEPIYYGIMFSFCYSAIYGYLPFKFDKSIRAQTSGVVLNLTATIINLSLVFLTLFLKSNFYIINIIFAIVGILSYINI